MSAPSPILTEISNTESLAHEGDAGGGCTDKQTGACHSGVSVCR